MADLNYTLGLDGSSFSRGVGGAVSSLARIGLAIEGLKMVGAAFIAPSLKAAQFEKTTTAINTVTKSAQVTAAVMRDLTKLAADTPFEMSDLAPAARALLGAGTAASGVADQLRMLGDVAAGADTDVGGLVAVFNQVRNKGRLMGGEMIQFAERGVAGMGDAIAKVEGIDVSQVAEQIEKGKVSADDLSAAFKNMTSSGGIFFNAMVNQSKTFLGKLSTLSDAWDMLLVDFAAPINDALKPVIDDLGKSIDALKPFFAAIGQQVGSVVTGVRTFINELKKGELAVDALQTSFGGLITTLGKIGSIPFKAAAAAMPLVGEALMAVFRPLGTMLGSGLMAAANGFGAALLEGIAAVLQEIPGMGAAARRVLQQAFTMSTKGMRLKVEAEDAAAALIDGAAKSGVLFAQAAGVFTNTVAQLGADLLKDLPQKPDVGGDGAAKPEAKLDVGDGRTAAGRTRKQREKDREESEGGSSRRSGGQAASGAGAGDRSHISARITGNANDAMLRAQQRINASGVKAKAGRARMGSLSGFDAANAPINDRKDHAPLSDSFKTPSLDRMLGGSAKDVRARADKAFALPTANTGKGDQASAKIEQKLDGLLASSDAQLKELQRFRTAA